MIEFPAEAGGSDAYVGSVVRVAKRGKLHYLESKHSPFTYCGIDLGVKKPIEKEEATTENCGTLRTACNHCLDRVVAITGCSQGITVSSSREDTGRS